jgi:hypothetical protein
MHEDSTPAVATFSLSRGLTGCCLPGLCAPFHLPLGAVVPALGTLLLATFDPPFLPLWPLNLSTLALLGTVTPPLLRRTRLLLPIRSHLAPIATPFLPALGAVFAALDRGCVTTLMTPLGAIFTLLLTSLGTVVPTVASAIGAR